MTDLERIEAHYRHQLARLGEMLEACLAREESMRVAVEAATVKIAHLRQRLNQQLIDRGMQPVD